MALISVGLLKRQSHLSSYLRVIRQVETSILRQNLGPLAQKIPWHNSPELDNVASPGTSCVCKMG